jgi:type VI secretion system protein ImpF
MRGFEPSLLEKLFDDAPKVQTGSNVFKAISIEQYKESVARDLEGLLNSRSAFIEDDLTEFPNCKQSLMTFGLRDFSAMSLSNAYDRVAICRALEQAIARHENRLLNVQVKLDSDGKAGSGLHFTISAMLNLHPAREPVSFDAMLQPTTLQYSINNRRRRTAG